MQEKNPVVKLRENANMTRAEFAMHLGVSYSALASLEQAHNMRVSDPMARAFERAGYDGKKIQAGYEKWRKKAAAMYSRTNAAKV